MCGGCRREPAEALSKDATKLAPAGAAVSPNGYYGRLGESFFTASRMSLPGLNFTTDRAGIRTSTPGRCGFRPTRALQILTLKIPKFRISTFSLWATALVPLKRESTKAFHQIKIGV
jgi:hypothetical protein